MQRLLEDAEKISGIEYDVSSYADIVDAIHVVQTEMGITGTTAQEASSTIEGSVATMKGAWSNLVTGIADENANLDVLIGNLVDSVITVGENVIPRVEQILSGIGTAVTKLAPVISEAVPELVTNVLPSLLDAGVQLFDGLLQGFITALPALAESAVSIVNELSTNLVSQLPALLEAAMEVIVTLANGIAESLPELIPTIVDVVLQIVETLTSPDTLNSLIGAALAIMLGLAEGLIEAIPEIVAAIPTIIENLIQALIGAIPQIIEAGIQLFVALVENLPAIIEGIIVAIPEIIAAILEGLASLGGELADLFSEAWEGIKGVFSSVGAWFSEKFTEGKEKASEAWSNAKEVFSQHWENVKAGFAAVGDWFSEKFTEGKENASNAWNNAKQLFSTRWANVKSAFSNVGGWFTEKFTEAKNNASAAWDNAKSIFSTVWGNIKSAFNISDALSWGRDMIQNFINGITSMWQSLSNTVSSVAHTVRDFLGFSEPKKGPLSNFHTYAPDMMNLFIKGIKDNEKRLKDQIEKTFDFGERTITAGISYSRYSDVDDSFGKNYGVGRVSVVQNIYSEAKTAADLMQEAIYQQERAVLLGV